MATAPTSADQRLINPAAATLRNSYGFALDLGSQSDEEKVLGLVDASIEIKTAIQSVNTNTAFRIGQMTGELSLSPQKGKKETVSLRQTSSGPNNNWSTSDLTLIPLQAIVSSNWGSDLSLGLKLMFTSYEFNDGTVFSVNTPTTSQDVDQTGSLNGTFLVAAPGFIYQLGDSGFSLAYVAEFFQFQNNQRLNGTTKRLSYEGTGVLETTVIDIDSKDTILARKDVIGAGYMKKFSGGNSFRSEISFERMPPLTRVQGYPHGQLIRLISELNFLFFRIGAEATRQSGYYVDPYNLIPYFFEIDHLGVDAVTQYGFFGGLKTSKGHGFGASFSQTKSTAPQKLSVGTSPQEVEQMSTKFGLNYSYFF